MDSPAMAVREDTVVVATMVTAAVVVVVMEAVVVAMEVVVVAMEVVTRSDRQALSSNLWGISVQRYGHSHFLLANGC